VVPLVWTGLSWLSPTESDIDLYYSIYIVFDSLFLKVTLVKPSEVELWHLNNLDFVQPNSNAASLIKTFIRLNHAS
jgi:hypothetical protein